MGQSKKIASLKQFAPSIFVMVLFLFATPTISAEPMSCDAIFKTGKVSKFAKKVEILDSMEIQDGPAAAMDRALAKAALGTKLDAPIPMSEKMSTFRRRVLPELLAGGERREAVIRLSEAQQRARSEVIAEAILKAGEVNYDLVIQGGGVHSAIFAARLKMLIPNLRILIVEMQDTVGSNFRLLGDMIRLNSTVRASGNGTRPLPREGNVNLLPFLPIQVSDLASLRFPYAKDLGDPLVSAYHALSSMEGVDVLLSTKATALPNTIPNKSRVQLTRGNSPLGFVTAYRTIRIPGLGGTKLPPAIESFLRANPDAGISQNGELPLVSTYEIAMHQMANSNNPAALAANKIIGVGGDGNSGGTVLEAIGSLIQTRSFSNAEVGLPSIIYWFGQSKATCEAWGEEARSRYNELGALFPSTKTGRPGIARGIEPKVLRVEKAPTGRGVRVFLVDETFYDADHLIMASGGEKPDYSASNYVTVADQVTNFGFVNVALFDRNTNSYIAGPGAGNLNPNLNLFNVAENFVAIFRNAPLVVKLAERLAVELKGMDNGPYFTAPNRKEDAKLEVSPNGSVFAVNKIYSTRTFGAQNVLYYLTTVFDYSLAQLEVAAGPELNLQLNYNRENGIILASSKSYAIKNLVESLATTKDFFNLSAMMLSSLGPSGAIQIKVVKGKSQISIVGAMLNGELSQLQTISNGVQPIRTAGPPTISRLEDSFGRDNIFQNLLNTRIQDIQRIMGIESKPNPIQRNRPPSKIENILEEKRSSVALPMSGTVKDGPAYRITSKVKGNPKGEVERSIIFTDGNYQNRNYLVEGEVASIDRFNSKDLYKITTSRKDGSTEEYVVRVAKKDGESQFIWRLQPFSSSVNSRSIFENLLESRTALSVQAERGTLKDPDFADRFDVVRKEEALALLAKENELTSYDLFILLNTLGLGGAYSGRPLLVDRLEVLEKAIESKKISFTELSNFYVNYFRLAFSARRLVPGPLRANDSSNNEYADEAGVLISKTLISRQTSFENIQRAGISGSITIRTAENPILVAMPNDLIGKNFVYETKTSRRQPLIIVSNGLKGAEFVQELSFGESSGPYAFKVPIRRISEYLNIPDLVLVEFRDGVESLITIRGPRAIYKVPEIAKADELFPQRAESLKGLIERLREALSKNLQRKDSLAIANQLETSDFIAGQIVEKIDSLREGKRLSPAALLFALQVRNVFRLNGQGQDYSGARDIFKQIRSVYGEEDFKKTFQGLAISYYRDLLLEIGAITFNQVKFSNTEGVANNVFNFDVKAVKGP